MTGRRWIELAKIVDTDTATATDGAGMLCLEVPLTR
jgi:hypothetical protein